MGRGGHLPKRLSGREPPAPAPVADPPAPADPIAFRTPPARVACLAERTDCGPDCSRPVADEDREWCREVNNRRLLAGKDEG